MNDYLAILLIALLLLLVYLILMAIAFKNKKSTRL
jgi:hypothetical protein